MIKTMKNQELSIIIPVYNGQNYIADCVNSVLNQQNSEKYEIIIINDGSTDNTSEILGSFARANKNISVINQKNSGVSVARNTGIDAAHGRYISFVDCDDMVGLNLDAFDKYFCHNNLSIRVENLSTTKTFQYPKHFNSQHFTNDYFTNMLRAAHETKADVILGGKITINDEMSYCIRQVYDSDFVYNHKVKNKITILHHASVRESANFALFNRKKLNEHNLRFLPNMHLDEDILFCMLAVLYAQNVATVKNVTYFYNRHPDTLSNMINYQESVNKFSIACIQRFSYLLREIDKQSGYEKLFSQCMKEYSRLGLKYPYLPGEFPPEDCHYWCEKQECKGCNIAQEIRNNLTKNIQRYS
jgi:glycosyltransferase involved in cell wall biosynthesis